MAKPWAKLFALEDGSQLLAAVFYNEKDSKWCLSLQTVYAGMLIGADFLCTGERDARRLLDEFDQEEAKENYELIVSKK